nr:MAG TPA: Large Terminase [Caudoviricetes sp.]
MIHLQSANPFFEFIERSKKYPDEYPEKIHKQIKMQEEMLHLFEFREERGKRCVDWIEKFCILTEGENAGKPVKLLLWQKWFYYSIFCFYGEFEEPEYDTSGNEVGKKIKVSRVVNDVMLLIASGNAKTTTIAFLNTYMLYSPEFASPNIFIGSNSHQQSRICFDCTMEIIKKNRMLKKYARIVDSRSRISVEKTNSLLVAVSSDGDNQEGIIPAVIEIDEIHVMKDSAYADNLRKSTKRSDMLIIESSTHGTVRGGYLDIRYDYATKVLDGETEDRQYRSFFAIFEQDSENEVFEAYRSKKYDVFKKSNPSLGFAVDTTMLTGKIREMIDDPSKRTVNLTKNFNIPQNGESSFFSKDECMTNRFDEEIFCNAPVFIGLDMAWTRSPSADLACISLLMVNPFTEKRYYKDIFFLPKYYNYQSMDDGALHSKLLDMIELKSKQDSNILYNKKEKKYGYQLYANKGDVVIIDEALCKKIVDIYGVNAKPDMTGVTEDFIIYYLAYLELLMGIQIVKFGLDPNKASKIEAYFNANVATIDNRDLCVKFQMEKSSISNPVLEKMKDVRAQKKVFCNNRLTELHFAEAQKKETSTGFKLVNPKNSRKDGVIAEAAAESAYNVFTTNKFTGSKNMELLKDWWRENEERINALLETGRLSNSKMEK